MRSHFPIVELGKHVRQVSQRNRADTNVEVFSVTNSEGFTKSTDYFSKEVFSKDISNYKVVSTGQFAYNPSRINVGSIDHLRHSSPVLVSPLYVVFESDKDVHADYLLRYLKSNWGNSQIRANTEGAVRDSLKFKGLESIKIPLPPVNDQIRIAHLLCKVEGLIAQRKQHLQQLDDLLKSVFLEIFGDPVRNEKGWEVYSLGSICDVQGGLQVTTKRNDNELDAPYLRVANVYRDRLNLSEIKRIGLTPAELDRVRLQKGDLLIVEGHGNPEEVGRSAVWDGSIENCVHQNHLIRVRVNSSHMTPLYASFFINSPGGRQQMFRAGKTTSGLNTISSKNVKETMVAVPPLGLQNQFAVIAEKVESIKSRYQQSLTDLEALYGALSQQAFKGELDLSRVPLPVMPIVGESTVASSPLSTQTVAPVINLPDTDLLLAALENREHLKPLLYQWLEAYRAQLGDAAFSVDHFMTAAQTRLAELHPDNDFELGIDAYELIKAWVFDQIGGRKLKQTRDIICVDKKRQFGNKLLLRARKQLQQ